MNKSFIVVIDQFTDRIFDFENTILIDYGAYAEFQYIDNFYWNGVVSGYGNYDDVIQTTDEYQGFYLVTPDNDVSNITSFDPSSNYLGDFDLKSSTSFTDGFGNIAYADAYDLFVWTDQTDEVEVGHGDWVVNTICSNLEDPNYTTILCIDVDTLNGVGSHLDNLFIPYDFSELEEGLVLTNLEILIYNFLFAFDQRLNPEIATDQYAFGGVSISIAGAPASSSEVLALQTFSEMGTPVFQAAPNVGQGYFDWGSNFPDVINVGAWNQDINGNLLVSSVETLDTVDLVADGYVSHPEWGSNFGTSFATPAAAAEWLNVLNNYLADMNANGEDLPDETTEPPDFDYTELINGLVSTLSTQVFVDFSDNGINDEISVPVLTSSLIANGELPRTVEFLDQGIQGFQVANATQKTNQSAQFSNATLTTGGHYVGKTLTASIEYSDPNGTTGPELIFYWFRKKDDVYTPVSSGGNQYTLTEADVGSQIVFEARLVDDDGYSESSTPYGIPETIVRYENSPPIGFTASISGSATENATLTASASVTSDADGLDDPVVFSYQWQSSSDNSNWSDISGATSAQFTPDDAQVGSYLRVVASYTDNQGTIESLASSATSSTIANVNDDPAVDLRLVSRNGSSASFSVFATSSNIPALDGIGSFEFLVSHTPGVLRIDGNSVIGGAGYSVLGNYDENIGKFTVGGFALPDVTDLSLPLATFDLTILDNNLPIELAITDLITDSVSQGPVSKTFDFSGADIDITVLDRNQDELSDVSIQVDVTGTDQEVSSYDYSTGATGSVTHSGTDGDSILISADKLVDEKSEQAIGSFDALQALRLAVGLSKSDGTKDWSDFIAADFNQDGRVGSDDALNILKYAVGLKDGPSSDWVFLDADADWSGIGYRSTDYNEGASVDALTSDTSVNLIGILTGDLDKSFIA